MTGGGFAGGGPVTTKLVIAIGAVSVGLALLSRTTLGAWLYDALLFSPGDVLGGRLWQVVTYAFVHPILGGGFAVLSFVFALLFLWSIGGQVEAVLGSKRFLGVFVGLAGLGALLTIPCALLLGAGGHRYDGVWVALSGLIILFADAFPSQTILFSLFIPVRGRTLILLAFGFLGLMAIATSPVFVLPEFFTMVAALAYSRGLFRPRRAWLRFRAWRIERELRRRSSHLSVIPGDRDRDRGPHAPGTKADREGRGPWLH
jgi:membrane associated rhomboid family serine protease